MTRNTKITNTIADLVGNTPLIKLHKITKDLKGTYLAKYEAFNPGHSAKDRIALHIIENAEKKGILKPGDTIVETTSGNTGFSLSMIAAIKGYKCIVAVSNKSSFDKIDMLKAMGADVYICPSHVAADHPHSYYEVAKRIQKETPNSIYINQYFNELNIEAHYATTGPEIWEQTEGKITHLIAASGTGGTISGTGKFLKEQNPNIKILGVDAYGSILKKYHETKIFDEKEIYSNKIEGLGKNLVPGATDFDVIDKYEKVTDIDAAYKARRLAKTEGLFTGYTSGAVLQAAEQYNAQGFFDNDSVVVMILPDHGSRYMNKIYSDRWMREQGLEDPERRDLNEVHYIK